MDNFLWQTVPKSSFYMQSKLLTTNLYRYPPQLIFIFSLAYTTHTNPSLQLILNYKKLLKCVSKTNFLHMKLNNKKAEIVLIPLPCIFPTETTKAARCVNTTYNFLILLLLSFRKFLSFVIHQYQTLFGCHAKGINSPSIFFMVYVVLFKSITPNIKYNKNNIGRIILLKIIIIKVNIIQVYIIKADNMTKECNNVRVYNIKVCITIRE